MLNSGWLFGQLDINGLTLDLDSTVMTRYGSQQGAAKGYNPAKRGRKSHHPLMAFVDELSMVAKCWLRPGNVASANNVRSFMADTLHRLGGKQVALLRAHSGFDDNAFLEDIEGRQLHYTVALKQTPPLQRALPIFNTPKKTSLKINNLQRTRFQSVIFSRQTTSFLLPPGAALMPSAR